MTATIDHPPGQIRPVLDEWGFVGYYQCRKCGKKGRQYTDVNNEECIA